MVYAVSPGPAPQCETAPAGTRCMLCGGEVEHGERTKTWVKPGFALFTLCREPDSTWVCEACVYVCSRTSAVTGRPPQPGKKFGGNFRNFCHFGDADWIDNASKGEKPTVRAFLAEQHEPPWFCGVIDSGQKHVLPFTPLN